MMPNFEDEIMCKKLCDLKGLSAEEILLLCNIKRYPVSIEAILKKLGISFAEMDFSHIEETIPEVVSERGHILGAVTIIGDDVNMFYSKNSSHNRMRFTLAHELAHCCLNATALNNKGHIEFRFDARSNDIKEMTANIFAGQLLIPEKPLRELYDSLIVPAVDVLANEFNVSISVMKARLTYLGLGFYTPQNYLQNNAEEA